LLYISLIAVCFLPWKIAVFGAGPWPTRSAISAYVVKLAVAWPTALFETDREVKRVQFRNFSGPPDAGLARHALAVRVEE
jgi:hypothetical protein